jgi:hypothetical protein
MSDRLLAVLDDRQEPSTLPIEGSEFPRHHDLTQKAPCLLLFTEDHLWCEKTDAVGADLGNRVRIAEVSLKPVPSLSCLATGKTRKVRSGFDVAAPSKF